MSEEKTHAPIGGSTIKRVLRCPGSVVLASQCPVPPESEAAAEGTIAHACLEALLKGEGTAEELQLIYSEEMVKHAVDFQQIIDEYLFLYGGELQVETKVDLTDIFDIPPEWAAGTTDVGIVCLGSTLFIFDYKYGVGEIVEVETAGIPNEQLVFYAIGLAHKFDYNFENVVLGIYQPRGRHSEGPWRTTEITMEQLRSHITLWKKHVQNVAIHKSTKLSAGDHCKWCPGMPKCTEISKLHYDANDFDLIDMTADEVTERLPQASTKDLAPKTLSDILRKLPALEEWCKGMWDYAEDFVNRGGKIPGFKRVRGKGSRVWSKPKAAEQFFAVTNALAEAAYEPKDFLSPAKMEKALEKAGYTKAEAKKTVNKYTTRLDGKIQLVSEADARPSVEETSIEEFEIL